MDAWRLNIRIDDRDTIARPSDEHRQIRCCIRFTRAPAKGMGRDDFCQKFEFLINATDTNLGTQFVSLRVAAGAEGPRLGLQFLEVVTFDDLANLLMEFGRIEGHYGQKFRI